MTRKNWLDTAREKGLIVTHGRSLSTDTDAGDLETTIRLVQAAGFPAPVPEYRFHPRRKWRFDFAWPDRMVALEREGGRFVCVVCDCGRKRTVFVSRHMDRHGFESDAIKYATAAAMGWAVVRVTVPMITSGVAAELLIDALTTRGGKA